MGNFKGKRECSFAINEKDMGSVTLLADDKPYREKANIYATKVTLIDEDGKNLKAGTDYEKQVEYTYLNSTQVTSNGESVIRSAGEAVQKTDIIPVDTVINVTAKAKAGSGYTGTVSGTYRIITASISSAKVIIPVQTYTGNPGR